MLLLKPRPGDRPVRTSMTCLGFLMNVDCGSGIPVGAGFMQQVRLVLDLYKMTMASSGSTVNGFHYEVLLKLDLIIAQKKIPMLQRHYIRVQMRLFNFVPLRTPGSDSNPNDCLSLHGYLYPVSSSCLVPSNMLVTIDSWTEDSSGAIPTVSRHVIL